MGGMNSWGKRTLRCRPACSWGRVSLGSGAEGGLRGAVKARAINAIVDVDDFGSCGVLSVCVCLFLWSVVNSTE